MKLDPVLNFNQNFPKLPEEGRVNLSNAMNSLTAALNSADLSPVVKTFTSSTDNEISGNPFNEGAIVQFNSNDPKNLVDGEFYRVVNSTPLEFQLTSVTTVDLIKEISTIGNGKFTIGNRELVFNLVRDIDYSIKSIVFPDHNLKDGDIIVS